MGSRQMNERSPASSTLECEVDLTALLDQLAAPPEAATISATPGTATPGRTPPSGIGQRPFKKRRMRRPKPVRRNEADVFDPVRYDFPALIELLDQVTKPDPPLT